MNHHDMYIQKIVELAERYADKTAITFMRSDGRITKTSYNDIFIICEDMKKILDSVGVVAGDRVAIVSPHSPQALLTALGLAYSNVQTVLIDASLPGSEINRLLKLADVRGLFVTEYIHKLIEHDNKNGIPVFKLCDEEGKYILYEDSVKTVNKEKTPDAETDVIAILFSSGTTAQMKGIKVTYKSVLLASEIFVRNIRWKSDYKYLHVFPLNHIAGYATAHSFLFCGSEIGMIENMTSSKLTDALLTYEPDGFGMIPRVFEVMEDKIRENIKAKGKLVENAIYGLLACSGIAHKYLGCNIGKYLFKFITKKVFGRNIKTIGTGASICRASTSKFFIDLGLVWANFYASTETNVPGVSTGVFDRYPVSMAGYVKRNPEIEVYIHNPDENGEGEIYIKSELLMKGYFREAELTQNSYDGEFFKTGDYGYIDRKGNLYVTGRIKESILLRSGKKISPIDIENYYKKYAAEVTIACVGCPKEDANYDEVYMFIQTSDLHGRECEEIATTLQDISNKANDLYKISYIKFTDKIPLTSVGKVKRFELQERVLAERNNTPRQTKKLMSEEDVYTDVIQLVQRILVCEWEVTPDSKIREDLGIDSLTMFEIQTEMETLLGKKILLNWEHIITIQDLIDRVQSGECTFNGNSKESKEYFLVNRKVSDIRRVKWFGRFLKCVCHVKYEGLENLMEEPCILTANHSSHLDILCLYNALVIRYGYKNIKDVCCLAAKDLLQKRFMKKVFATLGAIPVDRKNDDGESLTVLTKNIQRGYSAVVFPEGTRTRTGNLGKFADGAAKAAIATKVPIIPIGITGSYDIWPPMRKLPQFSFKRKVITVNIGAPIYTDNDNCTALTIELEKVIKELYVEK